MTLESLEELEPLDLTVPTAEAMHNLGGALGRVLGRGDVLVLTGPLGAGKTTFTRGLGEALGVRGPVTSPTFVLARTHPSLADGPDLIHVDAYRLGSALELDDLDLDLPESVTVIEWGSAVVETITDSWLELTIERPRAAVAGEQSDDVENETDEPRTVRIHPHGPKWTANVWQAAAARIAAAR